MRPLLALAGVLCVCASAGEVSISVFGLFHPRELVIAPVKGRAITWKNGSGSVFTETSDFVLSVPGRIERRYHGRLTVYEENGELIPVVFTDMETAVASIVAAESPPGAPLESLKAQAVVARSYLAASTRRHRHSDFCDTTHCQFVREPPAPASLPAKAASATAGLILKYEGRTVEALYSADCGGRTRTAADARLKSTPYPFFPVDCPVREGAASGHRIGLCQRGSAALARDGVPWRDILRRYFPGTTIE